MKDIVIIIGAGAVKKELHALYADRDRLREELKQEQITKESLIRDNHDLRQKIADDAYFLRKQRIAAIVNEGRHEKRILTKDDFITDVAGCIAKTIIRRLV